MAVIGKILSGFSSCQRINLFSITRYNKRNLRNCSVLYATSLFHTRFNKYISLSHYFSTSKYSVSSEKSKIRIMAGLSPLDPSSYSRPEIAIIKHISLNLNVAFENKTLNGSAVLDIDVLEDCNELILDSNHLCIESVQLEDGSELEYTEDNLTPKLYGTKLTIKLPKQQTKGDKTPLPSVSQPLLTDNVAFYRKYVNFNQECCEETEIVPIKHTQSTQVPGTISLNFTGYMYEIVEDDLNADYQLTKVGKLCTNPTKSSQICSCKKYMKLKIKITYKTSPNATALQWLEPSQTSGKKFPYLFSQCQPIHARSIVPCQDTPAVKFTYDAEITAPEEFTVLMSALRGKSAGVKTAFTQPIPIPSYLLALAVGVLEYRRLGPRSLVWAEKEEIERSAWEFADTEKYLQAAEKLCGQYQWSQYDLLVLPPSFPYGGMENPCLTFVTPTLLAGDRSQADVIVHEIMHSWTGNLVTNRNFEHFWLNEGFTVFLERKVASSLIADSTEARKSRDFHSLLGLQELSETVNDHLGVNSPLTNLVPSLKGVHPDDAFSRVPYEKGSLFLRYLEDTVGGAEVFDGFLRSYLNKFQKKSLDTNEFKEALFEYFKNDKENSDKLKAIDWDSWLYTSGMPPIIPDYDISMTKAISSLVAKISNDTSLSYEDVKAFTPHQIINLLQELIDRPPLSMDKVRQLGEAYKVNDSKNSEIQYRWIRLCIRSRDFDKLDDAFEFVNKVGRMKYVRPIYRDLYAWEEVRQRAIDNFLKHEQCMMHVTAYTLRKDLHLNA